MADLSRANAKEWDDDINVDGVGEIAKIDNVLPPAIEKRPAYAATSSKHPDHDRRKLPDAAAQFQARSRSYENDAAIPSGFHWHSTLDAKKQTTNGPEQPPLLIDIEDGSGNEAEDSWRRHEPPMGEIMVPPELGFQGQHLESIARSWRTFISTKSVKGGNEVHCGIWGAKIDVKSTKQAIVDWIKREMPSKHVLGTSHMPKIVSLLPKQLAHEEKKWKRAVKKQKYRQFPPMGTAFGAIGTFHWPAQEYRPEDVLGRSYEALDPMRIACACYIVFEKDISSFHLMGDSNNVKQALLRMRKVCFQVAARQLPTFRSYFLHFRDQSVPSHVVLTPHEYTKKVSADEHDTAEAGKSPRGEGSLDDEAMERAILAQSAANVKRASQMLIATLQRLHYYRGHLELRVRLGTFIATQYRLPQDGVYSIEDFGDMLQQSQFVGAVTPELGDVDSEKTALESLQAASNLLTPQSGTVESLSSIKPIYSVVLIFPDLHGDIRLIIAWQEHDLDSTGRETTIDEVSRKWLRLERGAESATPLVDTSLCNIQNGSAWQLYLVATQTADVARLPPGMRRLADSIIIDGKAMRKQRADVPWVKYVPYTPVKTLQQRASYRYGLGRTDYTVELTRFQDRVFTAGMHINNAPDITAYQPRWSLEVLHNDWDTIFTANERVAVGEKADWDDDLESWFPPDWSEDGEDDRAGGQGFEQLVARLCQLEAVVLGGGGEKYGGMDVG